MTFAYPLTAEAIVNLIATNPCTLGWLYDCFECGGGFQTTKAQKARASKVTSEIQKLKYRGFIECKKARNAPRISFMHRGRSRLWFVIRTSNEVLRDQLSMTMRKVPTWKTIRGWSAWERLTAQEYCEMSMLRASDNIVRVPPPPPHLKEHR